MYLLMAFINHNPFPSKIFDRHTSLGWTKFGGSQLGNGYRVAMAIVSLGIPGTLISLVPHVNLRTRGLVVKEVSDRFVCGLLETKQ